MRCVVSSITMHDSVGSLLLCFYLSDKLWSCGTSTIMVDSIYNKIKNSLGQFIVSYIGLHMILNSSSFGYDAVGFLNPGRTGKVLA